MKKSILTLSFLFTFMFMHSQMLGYKWAKQIVGGTGPLSASYLYSMAIDGAGNVYSVGYFGGTVDFDPGPGSHNVTAVGMNNAYILKLDSSGNFLWVKTILNSNAASITLDAYGHIYISGTFDNTVDFDPGVGTFNLTAINYNVFILKLDTSGSFIWAKSMGGKNYEYGGAIAVSNTGDVYITGVFRDTTDFDPGVGVYNLHSYNSSDQDAFISKLDSSGNFKWAKKIGDTTTNSDQSISSIAIDVQGNIYLAGSFNGKVDFNLGPGVFMLTSNAMADIFMLKLNASGDFIWAKNMGGVENDYAYSMVIDKSDNIYITGTFYGTVDFDPGAGNYTLYASGFQDLYIAKYDSAGSFIWAQQLGQPSNDDNGNSIAVDTSGNVYVTGSFAGTVDFNAGSGINKLVSSLYSFDIFILKLTTSGSFVWAKNLGGTYDDNGLFITTDNRGNIFTSGYFKGTADFNPGPAILNFSGVNRDAYILKLGTCQPTYTSKVVTVCASYTLNNQTYTNSGIYNQILTNINGCDSIIVLDLTIKNVSFGSLTQTACKSFLYNGLLYNQTAVYTFYYTNAIGCDSIFTLDLTIKLVNTLVTQSGPILKAKALPGNSTYQWVKCPSYAIIAGETNQSYFATANGSYAVFVTQNGCTDTSACITVTDAGIDGNYSSSVIKITPNPNRGLFNLQISEPRTATHMEIYNNLGEVVYTLNSLIEENSIDLTNLANGLYYLKIFENGSTIAAQKIMITD